MSRESNAEVAKSPARHGMPELAPAFLRIGDVLRITALSRPTIYRRIAARRFPRPIHLGGRACGWASAALRAWIEDPEGYRASPPVTPTTGPRRARTGRHKGSS
jgi:prophage regulatory protein